MLLELSIRDFAIIDDLSVGFAPGLNVMTGETGAGKSIIIDALGAVLGERAASDSVRTGAKTARIDATFDVSGLIDRPDLAEALSDVGVEPDDGLLILSRDISAVGKSTARVNGRAVTASMLARVGNVLVDIHGQSDHLSLLRSAEHLHILDRYAGLLSAREVVSGLVDEVRITKERLSDIVGSERERQQRADMLRFHVAEISEAGLVAGEDDELLAERAVLEHAERLVVEAASTHSLLVGGDDDRETGGVVPALAALHQAAGHLADISGIDPTMVSLATRFDEIRFLLDDVAREVRSYRDRIEADPARLAAVEDRLETIRGLKRKYGSTIDDVLRASQAAERELEELQSDQVHPDRLEERIRCLESELGQRAFELSLVRAEAGTRLAGAVEEAIAELNMGRAQFDVKVTQRTTEDGVPFPPADPARRVAIERTGADRVEFRIAPNAGEALKPLERVASGGETARLMLALKSILSEADATPTLVFDEIDVGVGARSGQVIGDKLWRLAEKHQVLVITHLPQIAAFADAHLRIEKRERDGRVTSSVAPIEDDDRVDELATMLDGWPVTVASRHNASAMLQRVVEQKISARNQTNNKGATR